MTSILKGESLPFEEQSASPETDPDDSSDLASNSIASSSSSSSDDNQDHTNISGIRALVAAIDKKHTIKGQESWPPNKAQERKPPPDTEVGLSRDAIKDVVNSLYKIATVIRRPLPSDRHTKSMGIDVHHFAEFDQRYVCDKFPSASSEILARLGKGITRRRQLLKYREFHSSRLQFPVNTQVRRLEIREVQRLKASGNESQAGATDVVVQDDSFNIPDSSQLGPSTKATTFVPPMRTPMVIDEVASVADTSSSYQSTNSGREILRIPPRPRDTMGKELETFECPYCHVLCEITSWQSWKYFLTSQAIQTLFDFELGIIFSEIWSRICAHTPDAQNQP